MKFQRLMKVFVLLLVFSFVSGTMATPAFASITTGSLISGLKSEGKKILKKSINEALKKLDSKIKNSNSILTVSKDLLNKQNDAELAAAIDTLSALLNKKIDRTTLSDGNLKAIIDYVKDINDAIKAVNKASDKLIAKLCKDVIQPFKVNLDNLQNRKNNLEKMIDKFEEAGFDKNSSEYKAAVKMLSNVNTEISAAKALNAKPKSLEEYDNAMYEVANMFNTVNASAKVISTLEDAFKKQITALYNEKLGPYQSNIDNLIEVQKVLTQNISFYETAKGDKKAPEYTAAVSALSDVTNEIANANSKLEGVPSTMEQYNSMCDEIAKMFNLVNSTSKTVDALQAATKVLNK